MNLFFLNKFSNLKNKKIDKRKRVNLMANSPTILIKNKASNKHRLEKNLNLNSLLKKLKVIATKFPYSFIIFIYRIFQQIIIKIWPHLR
mgnify:CR=1 FL=1